ncbi:hypothetical protein TNCV_2154171 [Trichonephila clavipes]|nr:hypothetical protein TNCV_2154171 [Trichonephila clavipes]
MSFTRRPTQDALDRPIVQKTATSDESRFHLSSDDNRVRVWRPRSERLNPAFALQRPTTIAYNTRSPLVLIRGTTHESPAFSLLSDTNFLAFLFVKVRERSLSWKPQKEKP